MAQPRSVRHQELAIWAIEQAVRCCVAIHPAYPPRNLDYEGSIVSLAKAFFDFVTEEIPAESVFSV